MIIWARNTSFPCKPIAAQFMADDIYLLAFEQLMGDLPTVADEKHYKLVPSDGLSDDEIASYGLH
ncbi:MAG: hypothetical protein ABSH50_01775 [Bryobacteraceae bacterium]